jgi:preprotein translocase subunit YajC
LSGTVTAVGSSSVTIQTSSATTTYAVTSTSDVDKNGEATLSDLAVGDAVTFSTVTTNGTTAIDKLHAGNAALDMPAGGPGGALALSGTVTAVGSSSVTIQTSGATTTYAVTSTSDIDKNGEATLSDLAVGDAVTFSTVTTDGTTAIDKLHAGNAALDMPPGGGPGAGYRTPPSGSSTSGSSA